jgi:thiamine transport system permease protein
LWLASGQSLLIALAAGSLATLLGSALLLTSRHLRVRDRKRRAAALWEASGSVILMIPAVVLSTGLFILFMPFADVFALGPWLVVLVNALMALPYVLRTLSAPMQLVVRQYDRLADSLGVRGSASPAAGGVASAAPPAGPGGRALDDPVTGGPRRHRHVRQPGAHHPALAALSAARQLPVDRGGRHRPAAADPLFLLFWLIERGLGGKHAEH